MSTAFWRLLLYRLDLAEWLTEITLSARVKLFSSPRQISTAESYCRTPGVGMQLHKNFNLAYNS